MHFTLTKSFPVSAATIYNDWLSSEGHANLTAGSAADIAPENGYDFTAWDGYISGRIIQLVPEWKIVMHWRTLDFKEADPDSIVTIEIEDKDAGCDFILSHEEIPEGQPDYLKGWEDHYFTPMETHYQDKK